MGVGNKYMAAWIGCSVVSLFALGVGTVVAWDAGPMECIHDVCNGGRITRTVPDTQPKYANSEIPGRLADCPVGFHNIGVGGCGRGADSISAPSMLPTCPDGYTNNGPAGCGRGAHTYTKSWSDSCRAGYRNDGFFCTRDVSLLGPSAFSCPADYFIGADQRCHKNCPGGYTNTGETCFQGVATKGPSAFSCKSGEVLGGGLNANKCFPRTATNPGPCSADRE